MIYEHISLHIMYTNVLICLIKRRTLTDLGFQNMKKVGEGTYGVVYTADFPAHPDPSLRRVALKRIRLDAYDFNSKFV